MTRARWRVLAGLGAGAAVFSLSTSAAFGAPTAQSFFPVHVPVVLFASDGAGTEVSVQVDVMDCSLVASSESPSVLPAPATGDEYLHVWLSDADGQNPFVALRYPLSAVALVAGGATVAPVAFAPSPVSLDAQWYFPVPDSITSATLELGAATITSPNSDGTSTTYAMAPAQVAFATQAPGPAPGPGAASGQPSVISNASVRRHGAGSAWPIGVGLGALFLAAAAAAPAVRRRRFASAHAKGRVRLIAVPLTTGPRPEQARRFVVGVLGRLLITGIPGAAEELKGPVKELAVYLVLNRGSSTSTLELVDRIWGAGRSPVTPETVRTYLYEFRKVFGREVLSRRGFTYTLSDAMGCDLEQYRSEVEASDQPAGVLRALGLVRGPMLEGSFVKAKNAPFEWAAQTADRTDREVVLRAHDTAESLLGADRLEDADVACAAGLRAQPSNLALRLLDLELGRASGGQGELARRLRASRAAVADYPEDVERLEARAGELGLAEAR